MNSNRIWACDFLRKDLEKHDNELFTLNTGVFVDMVEFVCRFSSQFDYLFDWMRHTGEVQLKVKTGLVSAATAKGCRSFEMPRKVSCCIDLLYELSLKDFVPTGGWVGSAKDIKLSKEHMTNCVEAFRNTFSEKFGAWLSPPLLWAGLLDPADPSIAARVMLQLWEENSVPRAPFNLPWHINKPTLQGLVKGQSLWHLNGKLAYSILRTFAPLKIHNIGPESSFRIQKSRTTERRMASQELISAEIRFHKNPTLWDLQPADLTTGRLLSTFQLAKQRHWAAKKRLPPPLFNPRTKKPRYTTR
eukprot:TRINITY_DN67870_c2_g1_i1.p1 TRINITY_DN67870_c2_g1~~TRINITY_DN67870_c2_g1_i1.p1  ORF type:complete len:302 (-),score=18.26 TRINITY_DN67870_c2_g1_i1:16-921(-)